MSIILAICFSRLGDRICEECGVDYQLHSN